MDRDQFLKQLDEVFMTEPGTLKGPEKLDDLGTWDSTAMMTFIALADQHYGVNLSPRKIAPCITVDDLLSLVGK